jgi:hypothetical protein
MRHVPVLWRKRSNGELLLIQHEMYLIICSFACKCHFQRIRQVDDEPDAKDTMTEDTSSPGAPSEVPGKCATCEVVEIDDTQPSDFKRIR